MADSRLGRRLLGNRSFSSRRYSFRPHSRRRSAAGDSASTTPRRLRYRGWFHAEWNQWRALAGLRRKAEPGNLLIIASYANYNELELEKFKPQLVYVDQDNRIIDQRHDIPVQAA